MWSEWDIFGNIRWEEGVEGGVDAILEIGVEGGEVVGERKAAVGVEGAETIWDVSLYVALIPY
jgi:hypothetical protein